MTTSPTSAERAALKVAQAATMTPDASYDLVSAVVFALGSAQLLQSPETAAELEKQSAAAQDAGYAAAIEVMRQEKLPMSVGLLEAQRELDALDAGVSPWQRAVDGLNALVDAGIGFHVEPDGHISNPFGAEHIEWDRAAERWRLVLDEDLDDTEPVPFVPTEPSADVLPPEVARPVARLRALLHPLDPGVQS